jgi:uncharacterized protein involved in response to NO
MNVKEAMMKTTLSATRAAPPAAHVLPIFLAARPPEAPAHGWPALRLGFRPFYLCAAVFGALAVPLWVAAFLGWVRFTPASAPLLWHAHEMLFGFAAAVIVGFLLTAGKAWAGLPTPRGPALGALVLLWLAARVAAVLAPPAIYALLDLALLPIVAVILLRLLLRARNRRNLPLAGLLGLLALANLVFHLAVLGVVDLPPLRALYASLALFVLVECVMAARVVPAFTMSATPGLKLVARPRLDAAALGATAFALAAWVLSLPALLTFLLAAIAAVLLAVRQWAWQPWVTRQRPILWILHLACACLPLGLGLIACAQLGWVGGSLAAHALAVGATGGLVIGMLTRTARGHTGRPLRASKAEVLAYVLVLGAAAVRVLLPWVAPQLTVVALVVAALAWSLAFSIYAVVFGPWLMQTRVDGKDG